MEDKAMIMMATYNGQKYISQQIESITKQSFTNWDLFIRDDGSIDKTAWIIEQFAEQDDRIHIIKKTNNIGGACLNFYELLKYAKKSISEYRYYFLSDQDDIWDVDKLFIEINMLKKNNPLLVYSDLLLMEENGTMTNSKMSDIHDINLRNNNDIFYNQIFIWGNTIGFNRELLEFIHIPEDISNNLSHDHYLAFYASAFGKIKYIDKPLTIYRRHTDNVSELPPNYSPLHAIKKVTGGIKPIIDRHAQSYCNVLYFIDHVPSLTRVLEDVRMSYLKNGLTAIKVLNKYSIRPGSNKYNMIMNYILLFSGLYKMSDNYRDYKKKRNK